MNLSARNATQAETKPCRKCKGKGYVLRMYPRRKPQPAHWFNRGPNGEHPTPCECDLIEGDTE
ncbi:MULTISPECIES: hypothetical protein [unclassified Sulfitobacter]|uniref:integrase n=1 Tax=Sulfitobacter phage pCB2047-A TaxID=754045 RepID=UPI0002C0715F|nr:MULTISPECIES: hypothetical protein [unclassified Sulfitobacter]YP_007675410.1 integrase [Sulfitobacter phage pCB2047-A]YP_009146210.1 integrase [Sulfitobacter phage NYA-2014a]AGH30744.1 putative integrase [Sulfitobacter phage pCB2047-A]AIM40667.1 hypothetical protein SUFP_036 [Sulfitobacter phage NYA-2014a]PTA99591.1 hypothetical protein C8254_14290 [Sulfitobacter sp. CB-A]ULO21258.1 hypothetical protein IV89_001219 [Sulfitobacter sp. CB2047]